MRVKSHIPLRVFFVCRFLMTFPIITYCSRTKKMAVVGGGWRWLAESAFFSMGLFTLIFLTFFGIGYCSIDVRNMN